MKCVDCPYCWKGEYDDFPRCHYDYNDGYAPCELEDSYDDYDEED